MKNSWHILNIAPTADKKVIRKAYAEQLKQKHPEEDPKGFQELREAYEDALNQVSGTSPEETSILEPSVQNQTNIVNQTFTCEDSSRVQQTFRFENRLLNDLQPLHEPTLNKFQIKALFMVDKLFAGDPSLLRQWQNEDIFADLELSLTFQEALLDRFYLKEYPQKLFLYAYQIFHWSELRQKIKSNPLAQLLEEIIDLKNLHEPLERLEEHQKWPLFVAALTDDLKLAKQSLAMDPSAIAQRNHAESTPLHMACVNHAIDVLSYLIEQHADLEATDYNGKTPLMIALQHESLECVKVLIAAGANPNHKDKSSYSPLYIAVATGCIAIILFLAMRPNIWLDSEALYYAVRHNQLETVKVLVDLGIDISKPSRMNDTPIQCAARYDYLDILSYLLDKGANPNPSSDLAEYSLLAITAKRGFEQAIKCLLLAGSNPLAGSKIGEPFELAMQQGYFHILKLLLDAIPLQSAQNIGLFNAYSYQAHIYGFTSFMDDANLLVESLYSIDENNMPVSNICLTQDTQDPLIQAIFRNDIAAFQKLLEGGADPNHFLRNGLGPLHMAIKLHRHDMFDLLLEHGADINLAPREPQPKWAYSPLFIAVKFQNTHAYRVLIDRGAIDSPTGFFHTAVCPAVYNNNLAMVKELVARGSDLNQCVHDGYRSLIYIAARYKCTEILKYLLSLGLHPDMLPPTPYQLNYGHSPHIQLTALTAAIKNGDLPTVRVLLQAGANPNRLSNGIPPLYFASPAARFPESQTRAYDTLIANYLAIIDMLLEAGADINAQDTAGETFLSKAIKNRELEIAHHLIQAGANINLEDMKRLKSTR